MQITTLSTQFLFFFYPGETYWWHHCQVSIEDGFKHVSHGFFSFRMIKMQKPFVVGGEDVHCN